MNPRLVFISTYRYICAGGYEYGRGLPRAAVVPGADARVSVGAARDKLGANFAAAVAAPLAEDMRRARGCASAKFREASGRAQLPMRAGAAQTFRFSVMFTPVRPLDLAKHFAERYAQLSGPANYSHLAASGATVVNMHQGNAVRERLRVSAHAPPGRSLRVAANAPRAIAANSTASAT